jgi:uncharacterized peroxidase-related enzyme
MAPLHPSERWQKQLYGALERGFGLNPGEMDEYTRTLATSKTVVSAISAGGAHRYIMFDSTVPRKLGEAIGVVVSAKNRCHFCADAHARALEVEYKGENPSAWIEEFVERSSAGDIDGLPEFTDEEKAVLRFARKAAENPRALTDGDFEELRAHGYSNPQILDVLAVVALFEMHNRIVVALGLKMIERFRRYRF